MSIDEMVRHVSETMEKECNVRAVFSEAVKLENHTVIPVATVGLGGGGGGTSPAKQGKLARFGVGTGALAFAVRPVGFIHESGGEVVFTPIHVEGRGNPIISEAAGALGRIVGAIASIVTRPDHAQRPAA